jgi:hypothetical protein
MIPSVCIKRPDRKQQLPEIRGEGRRADFLENTKRRYRLFFVAEKRIKKRLRPGEIPSGGPGSFSGSFSISYIRVITFYVHLLHGVQLAGRGH